MPFLFSGDLFQLASCFGIALAVSAALTPIIGRWARAHGMVAMPRQDRWHRQPTPLLGGVAIYAGSTVCIVWFGPHDSRLIGLVAGSSILFVTGLVDDFRHLRPHTKLICQIVAACTLVVSGVQNRRTVAVSVGDSADDSCGSSA